MTTVQTTDDQTTIHTGAPDTGADAPGQSNVDAHMPPQPKPDEGDQQNPVWAPHWNPETNEWAPSNEQHSVWGVAEPPHTDDPNADPVSESYGHAPSGTVPEAGMNLLTNVRESGAFTPPAVEHHHVIETIEQGSPNWRVRQVFVQGNQTATQLIEENFNRKRALLRVLPLTPGAVQNVTFGPGGPTVSVVVPAGQSWVVNSISYQYGADAVVANRFVRVTITNPTAVTLFQFIDATALTANQTGQVSLAPGNPTQHTGTGPFAIQSNLPAGLVLPAGSTITVSAVGADAGDATVNGVVQFTTQSTDPGGVFIAPRYASGANVAAQTWWKIIPGDSPLEIKIGAGVDAICANATDTAQVMILEETEREG